MTDLVPFFVVFFLIISLAGLSVGLLALQARAEKWAQSHPVKEKRSRERLDKGQGAR